MLDNINGVLVSDTHFFFLELDLASIFLNLHPISDAETET